MKKSKPIRKMPEKNRLIPFLFIVTISFAISTSLSYYLLKDKFSFDSDFIAGIEARQEKEEKRMQKKASRRLYGSDKQEYETEDAVVLRKDTLLIVAEDIIKKYVKPYKVRLLDLYLDKEGVIYIDFGDEIKRNFNGDAAEEIQIIAGLFSGIKSTIPGFKALKILIGGREAESFGGHIDISKPIGEEIAKRI